MLHCGVERAITRASIPSSSGSRQLIGGTAATLRCLRQKVECHQPVDVVSCRVGGTLGNSGPHAAGQLTLETIGQTFEPFDLPLVPGRTGPALPEIPIFLIYLVLTRKD